jgi:hypothetical protein
MGGDKVKAAARKSADPGTGITDKERLSTWMEEYKVLSADISKRVELQQRNFGLHNIFLSAIAAYLFNFGITQGFNNLLSSEVLFLIVIGPFISTVFTLRHLDHDSNIIDKATYIQTRVAPAVVRLTNERDALGFELFLGRARRLRRSSVGYISVLGNDHIIVLSYALVYVLIGFYIIWRVSDFGGTLRVAIQILVPVCAFLFLSVSAMSVRTMMRYSAISSEQAAILPNPSQ